MNKKGFTLMELLAVIALLSLIVVIVATKGFGAFNNTKEIISRQNIKSIKEAANVLMEDVAHCDETINDDIINKFSPSNKTCTSLQTIASTHDYNNECLKIKLDFLIEKNYINGDGVKEILKKYPNLYVNGCLNETIDDTDIIYNE